MFGSGHIPELLILLAVVLVIFGPSKLPDVGRGMGRAINEFRHAMQEPPAGSQTTSQSSSSTVNLTGVPSPAAHPVPATDQLPPAPPAAVPGSTSPMENTIATDRLRGDAILTTAHGTQEGTPGSATSMPPVQYPQHPAGTEASAYVQAGDASEQATSNPGPA